RKDHKRRYDEEHGPPDRHAEDHQHHWRRRGPAQQSFQPAVDRGWRTPTKDPLDLCISATSNAGSPSRPARAPKWSSPGAWESSAILSVICRTVVPRPVPTLYAPLACDLVNKHTSSSATSLAYTKSRTWLPSVTLIGVPALNAVSNDGTSRRGW